MSKIAEYVSHETSNTVHEVIVILAESINWIERHNTRSDVDDADTDAIALARARLGKILDAAREVAADIRSAEELDALTAAPDGCTDPDDEHADCEVPCGLASCDPRARRGGNP